MKIETDQMNCRLPGMRCLLIFLGLLTARSTGLSVDGVAETLVVTLRDNDMFDANPELGVIRDPVAIAVLKSVDSSVQDLQATVAVPVVEPEPVVVPEPVVPPPPAPLEPISALVAVVLIDLTTPYSVVAQVFCRNLKN